jgi:hypothetical protein
VRTDPQASRYLDRVLVTHHIVSAGPAVTGTGVLRWPGPPNRCSVYTIVLDRPLADGGGMIDAADHNLLISVRFHLR